MFGRSHAASTPDAKLDDGAESQAEPLATPDPQNAPRTGRLHERRRELALAAAIATRESERASLIERMKMKTPARQDSRRFTAAEGDSVPGDEADGALGAAGEDVVAAEPAVSDTSTGASAGREETSTSSMPPAPRSLPSASRRREKKWVKLPKEHDPADDEYDLEIFGYITTPKAPNTAKEPLEADDSSASH